MNKIISEQYRILKLFSKRILFPVFKNYFESYDVSNNSIKYKLMALTKAMSSIDYNAFIWFYYNGNMEKIITKSDSLHQIFAQLLSNFNTKNIVNYDGSHLKSLNINNNIFYIKYEYNYSSRMYDNIFYLNKLDSINKKLTKKQRQENVLNILKELFYKNYNCIDYKDKLKCSFYSCNEKYKQDMFYNIHKYVSKFNSINKNRSILLYGNPGTGKTILANQLMNELKYNYLNFNNFDNISDIYSVISDLKPDGIIIDDFDYLSLDNRDMLKIMENLHNSVKLIIYTANNLDFVKKHKAIIRPGRIDEFFEINKLNDKIILDILGKDNEDLLDKVKDFPIAFISECKNLIEAYDKQYLIDNLPMLEQKVKENSEKIDD